MNWNGLCINHISGMYIHTYACTLDKFNLLSELGLFLKRSSHYTLTKLPPCFLFKIYYWASMFYFQHTDSEYQVNNTQQPCYDYPKTSIPWRESNLDLWFLRRMRWPLHHASRACYGSFRLLKNCFRLYYYVSFLKVKNGF
jgi:hypothetical protein